MANGFWKGRQYHLDRMTLRDLNPRPAGIAGPRALTAQTGVH